MRLSTTATLAVVIALTASNNGADAFTVSPRSTPGIGQSSRAHVNKVRVAPLHESTGSSGTPDDEVRRLQEIAAKLRAEAASLESQQQNERNEAAQKAFQKFDTNGDGEVSLDELKAALEKTFKLDIPETRLQRLMDDFDSNGDGKLQPDEFVGVDQFRNRLEQITAEERKAALDEQRAAQAAQKDIEMAQMMESQLDMINDRTPTGTDKILSTLPYLFPLMDSIVYGQFLLNGFGDNPVALGLEILYTIYRSIPFSGFLAFFALSALGNNLAINRLVRYNIQQAIYLDISLITLSFFGGIVGLTGIHPPILVEALGSTALFLATLAVIGYASVSSLFGKTPDKIPFISEIVTNRLPPPAETLEFDITTGQFQPKEKKEDDDDKKDL